MPAWLGRWTVRRRLLSFHHGLVGNPRSGDIRSAGLLAWPRTDIADYRGVSGRPVSVLSGTATMASLPKATGPISGCRPPNNTGPAWAFHEWGGQVKKNV
jgi:hypothetical protein